MQKSKKSSDSGWTRKIGAIHGVTREAYFAAAELGEDLRLEPNDALAVDAMRMNNIEEIYSFDEDFDQIEGISRLPKL